MARQSNDLVAEQAEYRRLKNIEDQLVANDAEYKGYSGTPAM